LEFVVEIGDLFYGKTSSGRPDLKYLHNALSALTEQLGTARSLRYKPLLAVFTGLFLALKVTGIADRHHEVASFIFRSSDSSLDYISEVQHESGSTHLNVFQINDVENGCYAHKYSDDWKGVAMTVLAQHGIDATQLDEGISGAIVINHVQQGRPVLNENGLTVYKPQTVLSEWLNFVSIYEQQPINYGSEKLFYSQNLIFGNFFNG